MNSDICQIIYAARDCGDVHCHIIEDEYMTLSDLAPRFGLIFTPGTYKEIGREQAEEVARYILHKDLAYGSELMSNEAAEELVSRFFDRFDETTAQYYTNGNYYADRSNHSWSPATTATFDTGVLIVGKSCSGCLWVEDED